jgi:hypothetical protein
MDYESKCLISSSSLNSNKAEWTLESSNAKHVLQELAEVLPMKYIEFFLEKIRNSICFEMQA